MLEANEQRDRFQVWYPGGPNIKRSSWKPNDHLVRVISQANFLDVTTDSCGLKKYLRMKSALNDNVLRTDLDSHSNMVRLGRYAIIIEDTGKTVDVKLLTPDYNALQEVLAVTDAI